MVSSHFYHFDNRNLFLTKNTYKYHYTCAGADITSCTKDGDTPMYLAVYRITKQPQAFDPVCINILYNAGTVTRYQFQQNSCSPLSYCKHYQSNRYTTTGIATTTAATTTTTATSITTTAATTTTTAATTTTTHKAYFFLAQFSSPTDLTQLNWFYRHFYMKIPFILWMKILKFKKS